MDVVEEIIGDVTALKIRGRLDTNASTDFEKHVMKFIDNECMKLLIDCTDLEYISSSGLRIFLVALKKVTAYGGKFALCDLQDRISEVFNIAGFTALFTIKSDREEALAEF